MAVGLFFCMACAKGKAVASSGETTVTLAGLHVVLTLPSGWHDVKEKDADGFAAYTGPHRVFGAPRPDDQAPSAFLDGTADGAKMPSSLDDAVHETVSSYCTPPTSCMVLTREESA
jgi:hypothetical protein